MCVLRPRARANTTVQAVRNRAAVAPAMPHRAGDVDGRVEADAQVDGVARAGVHVQLPPCSARLCVVHPRVVGAIHQRRDAHLGHLARGRADGSRVLVLVSHARCGACWREDVACNFTELRVQGAP